MKSMRGAAVLLLVGLLAGMAAGITWAGLGQEQPEARRGQSVNICHAAGNGKYVSNSPDVDSIVSGQGHGGHPEDIIPPFDYEPKGDESGHYPGQNWNDEGQAIHANGCVAPSPPEPPNPPNCNAADVAATDSGGSGRNQFQQGDSVYFRAAHFPPGSTGTFSVTHNQSGSVVASGGFSTGSGDVVVFAWNGANAFVGDEGYRIEASAGGCSDGDNFQYRAEGPPPASLKLHVRKVVVGSDLHTLLSAASAAGHCRASGSGHIGPARALRAPRHRRGRVGHDCRRGTGARARTDRRPRDRPEPPPAEQRRQHGLSVGRDPATAAA